MTRYFRGLRGGVFTAYDDIAPDPVSNPNCAEVLMLVPLDAIVIAPEVVPSVASRGGGSFVTHGPKRDFNWYDGDMTAEQAWDEAYATIAWARFLSEREAVRDESQVAALADLLEDRGTLVVRREYEEAARKLIATGKVKVTE